MIKPLSAFKWSDRPTGGPVVGVAPSRKVTGLLVGLVSLVTGTTCCSSARTPTVLVPGSTDAAADGLAISAADLRGPQPPNAIVAHITDGDTISVRFTALLDAGSDAGDSTNTESLIGAKGDSWETIRLIGIDTPESKRPNTPIECFSHEASAALGQLLPQGTPVWVELDLERRDRYGRLLGYIFRSSDGLFVNHEMVRSGMAAAYAFPPNISYAEQFSAAATAARTNNVGLWSSCESEHEPAPKTS
jgi:endonuclease YncB( thermonuclease family)